jgi:hypothetical protein
MAGGEDPAAEGTETRQPEATEGEPKGEATPLSYLQTTIVGPLPDKILFYLIVIVAIVVFLLSAWGLISSAASTSITTVDLKFNPEFEYPGMFFCHITGSSDMLPLIADGTEQTSGGLNIITTAPDKGCSAAKKEYAYFDVFGPDGVESTTCISVPDNDKATEIAKRMKLVAQTTESWTCSVVNDNSQIPKAKQTKLSLLQHDMETRPNHDDTVMLVAGFFDPKLSVSDMFDQNFRAYFLNTYNTMNEIAFSMDTLTDASSVFSYFPATLDGSKDKMQKLYYAKINSIKMKYNSDTGTTAPTQRMHIRFTVDTFLTREVLIRMKSFSELWAEVGGAWASSLLVIGIFFMNKAGVASTGGVAIDTHVLRFRGGADKKAFVRGLIEYKGTAVAAAVEGADSLPP